MPHLLINGLTSHASIASKLLNLYTACNSLSNAHLVFHRIHPNQHTNLFLWNILIRAFAWNGPYSIAISLYHQLLRRGLQPDNFTFPFVLKACSALSDAQQGRIVHQDVARFGWECDVFVGAGLIDMYSKCGCVPDARQVFDEMPVRDVVVWNSMLAAYAHNGLAEAALSLCNEMVLSPGALRLTVATLVTVVSAAADIAAVTQGREIHGFSWRHGFEEEDKVGTALVDMYVKCGSLKVARELFERLKEKRVVSWNAMIAGYAMHGRATEALALFEEMKREGEVGPDRITFVGVLSACSHGGQLNEACDLIRKMSVKPDTGVWGSLLNGCKLHGNVELGELALEKLIELEPCDAGNYVILSNIYAQAGKWEGVARVRKLMKERGLKKSIACSWIKVKNKVHGFLVGDLSHSKSDEIYAELDRLGGLMIEAGYVPDIGPVFHDVEDDEKMGMVFSHSERLAIAFGIISTPPGTRLLITKNLRVCDDCHVVIKFISKITEREITVRDVNRYHHFKDGTCSCGDYW
ncbi:hypothetical protein Syun_008281 [Stephania yunnanensis]|uniref:DYW domain-containing protein n=1 Tax=Stephania yunnanensis TaxID=152371 RepID=A0AAP0KEV3_9MAGN